MARDSLRDAIYRALARNGDQWLREVFDQIGIPDDETMRKDLAELVYWAYDHGWNDGSVSLPSVRKIALK